MKIIENNKIKESLRKKASYLWIKATALSYEEVNILKDKFNLHPTTIEDILTSQTRAKYEEFEEYTLFVLKGIKEVKQNSVETYNISFIIGENFLITINDNGNDIISEFAKNQKKVEHILKKGEDYITHYIIDKEIDKYLRIKTEFGEELKKIEREFIENQSKEILKKIYSKELVFLELRQLSESATDLCLNLTKPADNYIHNNLIPYFKDVYDHAFKTSEGYKLMLDRMNRMKDMYATITSIKTNEIMRYLTIIMALMMPFTIITGFYGMNVNLPLQNHSYVYLFILGLMLFVGIVMILLIRKKGWTSEEN